MIRRGILISIFLILGCAEESSYERYESLIKTIETSGKTEGAYWLEQKHLFWPWAKDVLVFGYTDNYGACLDFIEINVQKYKGKFRCVSAD